VGVFNTLLLDIDPNYIATDYPSVWTQYVVTIPQQDAPIVPTEGRIAFRYFVETIGPNSNGTATRGDYIGIDTVSIATTEAPVLGGNE
jgi:hypothetical protein